MKAIMGGPVLAALLLAASPAAAEEAKSMTGEAVSVMMAFGEALVGELKAAVQAGGPVNGISVCNEKAPEIAKAVGDDKGWSVARSSHKLRNPDNAPDEFTKMVIEEFLARQASGENPQYMMRTDVVEQDGKKVFRFVKAIPTQEVCLTCHGAMVKPEVEAKLKELYPQDQARGFMVGEMRGVFTLQKVID